MARILLVEDDPDIALLTCELLEEAGHRVCCTRDGDSALQALPGFKPALVITDILMPNKGGLDLIREIRRISPTLPIIAVSGGGTSGKLNFLRSAQRFPGVSTLRKPADPVEFLQLVETTLENKTGSVRTW